VRFAAPRDLLVRRRSGIRHDGYSQLERMSSEISAALITLLNKANMHPIMLGLCVLVDCNLPLIQEGMGHFFFFFFKFDTFISFCVFSKSQIGKVETDGDAS
jgi:hypothetical protein